MKIAIGTDDGKTIRKGHFGSSRYYRIVEILNGEITGRELRRNSYVEAENATGPHGQSRQIIDLLKDCSLFIAGSMGKKSSFEITAKHIDCIITRFKTVDLAVSKYLQGKNEGFKVYDADSDEFISCLEREKKIGLVQL
jgi:predicted Fe-Mo cluster-binding NifX family protein